LAGSGAVAQPLHPRQIRVEFLVAIVKGNFMGGKIPLEREPIQTCQLRGVGQAQAFLDKEADGDNKASFFFSQTRGADQIIFEDELPRRNEYRF
jgi:hypothetical protein